MIQPKVKPRSMRSKEDAHDYRYFPDPDLLPLEFTQDYVDELAKNLPELPDEKPGPLACRYGAYQPMMHRSWCQKKPLQISMRKQPKAAMENCPPNWVINNLLGRLKEDGLAVEDSPVSPDQLGSIIDLIKANTISGQIAKDLFEIVWSEGGDPDKIVEDRGMKQVTDTGAIEAAVDEIIAANPDKVAEVKEKPKMAGWFVGQVMKATGGKASPQMVNQLLREKLEL